MKKQRLGRALSSIQQQQQQQKQKKKKKKQSLFYRENNQQCVTASINQSKHISITPYVASESEAHAGLTQNGASTSM